MAYANQGLPGGLTCKITKTMLKSAFSFGSDYFRDPAKVLQDRTGEKERGLGGILTDHLYGKVIELGVCKILKNNSGKKFFPDMKVKSEFDFGRPDIVKVENSSGKKIPLKKFVEIKYSPSNFQWIGLYMKQFDDMREYVRKEFSKKKNPDNSIIVIYANIRNKKTGEFLSKNDLNESEDVDAGNSNLHGEDLSVHNLTKNEKKDLENLQIELENLEKDRKDKSKFPWTISKKSIPHTLFPGMSLLKARKKNKENKELVDDEIVKKKRFIKNLKFTFQKRKEDLLGIYFKQEGFLPKKFDYFLKSSELEVVIEYIITGKELNDHGKTFPEGEIMPSGEIFFGKGKKNNSYDDGDLIDTTKISHEKIKVRKSKGSKRMPVEHITYKHDFSQHFGDLLCYGDVEFIKQMKDAGSTLFLKCNSDVKIKVGKDIK